MNTTEVIPDEMDPEFGCLHHLPVSASPALDQLASGGKAYQEQEGDPGSNTVIFRT